MSEYLTIEEKKALDEAKGKDTWPTELTADEKKLIDRTVKAHKACWGTGRVGFHEDGKPIVCRCVWKAWAKLILKRKADGVSSTKAA